MLTLQPPSVSKSFLSLPLSALRPKKSTTQVPDQETERYGFFVGAGADGGLVRSEEHTSELQSRLHLVCRLLLEKKKRSATCRPRSPSAAGRKSARTRLGWQR